MVNQHIQSTFYKRFGHCTTVFFATLLFCSSALFAHASTENTSVRLFPTAAIDATSSTPKAMAPGNLIVVSESESQSPAYALFSWPNTMTSYNENKYIELYFDPSSIPANAIIDTVAIQSKYYIPGSMIGGAKFEVWNGGGFKSFPVKIPAISGKAAQSNEFIDILEVFPSRASLDGMKIRFLSYGMGAAPMRTAHDIINVYVTYHVSTPMAGDQSITMSVDSSTTVTLTASNPLGDGVMTYSIVSGPLHGSLSEISDGQVVYTPDGSSGTDSFTYTASNGVETSAPATVSFLLTSPTLVSVGITASPSTVAVNEPITVTVTGYDHFGNILSGDSSTEVSITGPGASFSTPIVFTQGVATVTATMDHAGTVSFSASAAGMSSSTTTVTVTPPEISQESGASISVPTASPLPGQYIGTAMVSLSAATAHSIHYTADGSDPTCTSGAVYSEGLSLQKTQTIKAVSCTDKNVASDIATFMYTITAAPAPAPVPVPVVPAPSSVRIGGGAFSFGPALSIMGDVNGDGSIDMRDVTPMILNWGTSASKSDVNRDSKVNLLDFNAVMVNWRT